MTEYRVDLMGSEGHIESSRTFICDTDENAIVWAKQMVGQRPAELWIGTRLVEGLALLTKNRPSAMKFMKVEWYQRIGRDADANQSVETAFRVVLSS